MSHYNQNQSQATNPLPTTITPPNYVVPPSDVHATKDGPAGYPQYVKIPPRQDSKSKGDGFWRGCCTGWCCYCCLDICF